MRADLEFMETFQEIFFALLKTDKKYSKREIIDKYYQATGSIIVLENLEVIKEKTK